MADNRIKVGQIWQTKDSELTLNVVITNTQTALVMFLHEDGSCGTAYVADFLNDFEFTGKSTNAISKALAEAFPHEPQVGDVYADDESYPIVISRNGEELIECIDQNGSSFSYYPNNFDFKWTGETIPEMQIVLEKLRGGEDD